MRRLAIVILLLLFAGVGGYFGVDAYAKREAERQVDAVFKSFEAGGIKTTRGAVSFDLIDRKLDIADIALAATGDAAGTTRIGRFTASGFEQPSPDRVRAARIEVSGLVFEGAIPAAPGIKASYDIPSIVIENYEGPAHIVASSSEPWQLLLSFLDTASADKISVPSAIVSTTSGSGDEAVATRFTYGGSTFTGIKGGKIAHATIEPSSFQLTGQKSTPGSSANGEIGRVTAETIDIGVTLALLDPQRAPTDDSFRTIYGSIAADGYKVAFENGLTQQWGAISLKDFAIKPSGFPLAGLMNFGQRMQELQKQGEKPSSEELGRMLEMLAGLYDSVRLGGASLNDLTMNQPGASQAKLAALRVGSFSDGRLASISLEGFSGSDEDGKAVKLERFALNGLRPGEIMRLAASIVGDPTKIQDLATQFAFLTTIESIEIAGLVAPAGDEKDDIVKLDTLQLSWGDFIGASPSRMAGTLRIDGPIAALEDEEPFSLLADNGATRASVAIDFGLKGNEADKTVIAAPLFIEIPGAFSASAKIGLSNVDKAAYSVDLTESLTATLAANISSVEVTLTDAGIYAMKLKQMAADQGTTPEAVQQLFAGIGEMMVAQITSERPELEAPGKAVLAFLQEPKGRLSLKITPKASLPIVSVVQAVQDDPFSLLDEVTIEATTTR